MEEAIQSVRIALLTEQMAVQRKLELEQEEENVYKAISILQNRLHKIHQTRSRIPESHVMTGTLKQAAAAHSRQLYYEWSRNYHWKLPRELRDSIYRYVTADKRTYVHKYSISFNAWGVRNQESYTDYIQGRFEAWFRKPKIDLLLDTSKGNRQVIQELTEAHIQRIRFRLEGNARSDDKKIGCEELIPALFSVKPFGINVDLFANMQQLIIEFDVHYDAGSSVLNKECLHLLQNLRCKTAITIYITRFGMTNAPQDAFLILDHLSDWYFYMKGLGFEIRIKMPLNRRGAMYEGDETVELHRFLGDDIGYYESWKATWPKQQQKSKTAKIFFEQLLKLQREMGPTLGTGKVVL
ncbi:unnamed protein product [Periconia digitata]|uniref:Uncharacterized protein n=1 Tax=Periconia digitata TaxID=1303443 RepID=A0A9W4XJN6_9PLEO|nr:unnamed protein product [Periconia digitata]